MIVHLAFHTTQLFDVFAKVASYEFLATSRVRETGVGQFLTMWAEHIFFWTKEPINAHCTESE